MSVADSPLRDRVVFVEGAPRSGTTLLTALLCAHSEIAGSTEESHLFDRGLAGLFDLADAGEYAGSLIPRPQLTDAARDLCDTILDALRTATRPDATFVLDKTPAVRREPAKVLVRKREVYPDAFYVHIVRDRDEVVRSMLNARWAADASAEECERWWRDGVAAIREAFGGGPRYCEVAYADVVADPVGVVSGLHDWLGLEGGVEVAERIKGLANERYARSAPPAADGPAAMPADSEAPARGLMRAVRARASWRRRMQVGNEFASAFRAADETRLRELTTSGLRLTIRAPDRDLVAEGDEARRELANVARALFARRNLSEEWSVEAGRRSASLTVAAVGHAGRRVDLSCHLLIDGARVGAVGLISAAPVAAQEDGAR